MTTTTSQATATLGAPLRLTFFALLLLMLFPVAANAQFVTASDGSGGLIITKFTGSTSSVTIPSVINGLTVTGIGDSAFKGNTGVTSVTFPNTIKTIGTGAFSITGLTTVSLPASVTSISTGAFSVCNSLTSISVDSQNTAYESPGDGVLYNKAQTVLVQFPGGKSGSYIIPGGVVTVGDQSFASCAKLTSAVIPSTVTSIGVSAFANCSSLASVSIPNGITTIQVGTFLGCSSLSTVTIPSGVTTIGTNAFFLCSNLASAVFLGNAPTTTGTGMFASTPSYFTVYYYNGAVGFSSPAWFDSQGDHFTAVNLGSGTHQTISDFATISPVNLGVAPFTITPPTASSGLPVTVSVLAGPATISNNTVTVTDTGTVTLSATQSGNGTYAGAPPVTTSFVVNASVTDPFNGTPLSGGWYYSTWFGTYNSMFYAWIYRTDLGFMYVDTVDNYNLYLYEVNGNPAPMGWLYTNSSLYPYYYGFTKNTWLYYGGGTSFYNYASSQWENY